MIQYGQLIRVWLQEIVISMAAITMIILVARIYGQQAIFNTLHLQGCGIQSSTLSQRQEGAARQSPHAGISTNASSPPGSPGLCNSMADPVAQVHLCPACTACSSQPDHPSICCDVRMQYAVPLLNAGHAHYSAETALHLFDWTSMAKT